MQAVRNESERRNAHAEMIASSKDAGEMKRAESVRTKEYPHSITTDIVYPSIVSSLVTSPSPDTRSATKMLAFSQQNPSTAVKPSLETFLKTHTKRK